MIQPVYAALKNRHALLSVYFYINHLTKDIFSGRELILRLTIQEC